MTAENKEIIMFDNKKYGMLLADTLPAVIDSQAEYDRVESVFDSLFNKDRSPEEDRLFDLLADLLEAYEAKTLEPLPEHSPVEMLKFLMRENNLKQSDLADIFGGQSVVSEVLNGKREITKQQAKNLAERFKIKVEAFI